MRPSLVLICSLLAACTVGPRYEPPAVELPETFRNAPSARGADIAGLWTSLDDPALTALIERALTDNADIRQALAVLNETRALSGLTLYSWFPTASVSAAMERNTVSAQDPFAFPLQTVVERYRAGFDASWEIDVFGSLRQQSRSVVARAEADEARLYAVNLAVVAETVQAYFTWRGQQRRLELLEQNLELQRENLAMLEAAFDAGRGTALDIAAARVAERQLAAQLPMAEAEVERALQRLSVVTHVDAATLVSDYAGGEGIPQLPRIIETGTPEDWLAARPDILSAERRLASAYANTGVQVAEYFPKLNLVGSFGWTGTESSAIGDSDAERWQVAPGISWRLPDWGRLRQRVKAAEAQADGALAAYEQAWRQALAETETALATYRATTEREAGLAEAAAEAAEAARLARLRFDAGAADYFFVLDAERRRIEIEDSLALARVDRRTSLAALYKALGGDFAAAEAGGP